MMLSGAPRQDTAKYNGDQKTPCMVCRFTRPVNSAHNRRADTPLRLFTSARHSRLRRILSEQVHMVVLAVEFAQLRAEVTAHLPHRILARSEHVRGQRAAPVLRHEDQMNVERGCHVPATPGSPRGLS